MKMKLSAKILALIAAVLIVTAVATNLITIYIFNNSFVSVIDDNVTTSEGGGLLLLEDWTGTLLSEIRMIATQRMLQSDLEEKKLRFACWHNRASG